MAKIKEISVTEFRNRFSNQHVLQEAFSTIKNATLVKNNDTTAVILDEETGIFYDVVYEIDADTRQLKLSNFSPFVLKEEVLDLKETYARAMNVDLAEEESFGIIRKLARQILRTHFGGEKGKLVTEAKTKAYTKKVDRARKAIIEDLNLFKAQNRKLISEIKNAGFYERFVDKLNEKYLKDGVTVAVKDKLNFHLVEKRNKSERIKESVYVKSLDKQTEKLNEFFNPVDIVRNSPSFVEKLNLFMDNVHSLTINGKDETLEESAKAFSTFASNWPVLYTMSPERHSEFAIRHFSATITDKARAKEYVTTYNKLTEAEQFRTDQTKYLKENYSWSTEDLENIEKSRKLSESFYNAKLLDDTKRAIASLREKVDSIESINVANYLKIAEERLNTMLRSGRFNEELFEQFSTDIFGDANLITYVEKEDVFTDPDFKTETKQTVNEDEMKTFEIETKAHKLVVEMRDLMTKVDKTLRFALEEDFDLLKSMIAINTIEENKLNAIEKLVTEIKKSTNAQKEEVLGEDKKRDAWCVVCGSNLTKQVSEALAAGKKAMPCPSCHTETVLK